MSFQFSDLAFESTGKNRETAPRLGVQVERWRVSGLQIFAFVGLELRVVAGLAKEDLKGFIFRRS